MANKPLVVENPATGEPIGEVATFTVDEIPGIVSAADAAQKQWAKTPPRERAEVLRACWAAMLANQDDLAATITGENGKPLRDSLGEVTYAAEFFRWNSEEAVRLDGDVGDLPNGNGRKIVLRQPIGTVLAITPWNFPAAMLTRKLAPALAAGCAVVAKPASPTPMTAVALAELFRAAGLPDGSIARRADAGHRRCRAGRARARADPQAVVYGLHRSRREAPRASGRPRRELCDGVGRQCAVHRSRRRQCRRRHRSRDGREAASQQRDVHGGEPLLRGRVARRCIHRRIGGALRKAGARRRYG